MDNSTLGSALAASQEVKRLIPRLSKPENQIKPENLDRFNQILVSDVQYEIINYILEKLRILGATEEAVRRSHVYASAVKLFPSAEQRVYFILTILSNWPWIIISQFKLRSVDSRARVLEIIDLLLLWSRESGNIYNHVVRVIYLTTPGLWEEFLSRFIDSDKYIRSLCISISEKLLRTRDVAPLVRDLQEHLADRMLYDPDPKIRVEAMKATFEVASVYIERICNPYLIKALSSRIGDKETLIRMEAIEGIATCFRQMLFINDPKVVMVRHVFKMASAVLWLYKDKSSSDMKSGWKNTSSKQKISKLKLTTRYPIDLPDQNVEGNLETNSETDQDMEQEKEAVDRENEDKDMKEDRSREVGFKISEMERCAIETAVYNSLADVTNEDTEAKSIKILNLVTYCDGKALSSLGYLLLSQSLLRKQVVRLLNSTRADQTFYSSLKFITSKFDYLDDTSKHLNDILLDLRNDQELLTKLDGLFHCELSLVEGVEVANQFAFQNSSSPSNSSSNESEDNSAKIRLKEDLLIRSGVFFLDQKTLITILELIRTFHKDLSVRMGSFIVILCICYPDMFLDQNVKESLMSLNRRIHLILTLSNGIEISRYLPEDVVEQMTSSAQEYLKKKMGREYSTPGSQENLDISPEA